MKRRRKVFKKGVDQNGACYENTGADKHPVQKDGFESDCAGQTIGIAFEVNGQGGLSFVIAKRGLLKPTFIERSPLVALVGAVFPIFLAAPLLDLDCVHGCAFQFLIRDLAIFSARLHPWEIFLDETIQYTPGLNRIGDQPGCSEDDHASKLEGKLERHIRWEYFPQLARLKTDLWVALNI